MRFNTGFLLLASTLAFAGQAFALSMHVPDRVAAAPPATSSINSAVRREAVAFTHEGSAVMAPHDVELVRRVGWTYKENKTLLLAVIAKNAYVINATCQTGNIYTCAIGVTYSVFAFFFASWLWADRRAELAESSSPTFVFGPTPAMTLRQRVETELPAQQWHYLGHVAHGGVNHTVHYYNHGNGFHQMQAKTVPFWNATLAARDEDNDGGFVGDYYWASDNEGPYDSFDSSSDSTSYFASNAGGYMIGTAGAVSACAGFTDAQGPLDNGILAYGWNNQPYQWEDGQMEAIFGSCQGMLGDGPL